jgi:hypothetical protein
MIFIFRNDAKVRHHPDPQSDDQVEKFLAQNDTEQLEKFVFEKAHDRVRNHHLH